MGRRQRFRTRIQALRFINHAVIILHPRQKEREEISAAPKAIFGAQLQAPPSLGWMGVGESDFKPYSESDMSGVSGVSRFSCPESTPEVRQFCG